MQIDRNTDQNLLQNGAFLRGKKEGCAVKEEGGGGGGTCGRGPAGGEWRLVAEMGKLDLFFHGVYRGGMVRGSVIVPCFMFDFDISISIY